MISFALVLKWGGGEGGLNLGPALVSAALRRGKNWKRERVTVKKRRRKRGEGEKSICWFLHRNQWVLLAEGVLTLLRSLPGFISGSSTSIIIILERYPGRAMKFLLTLLGLPKEAPFSREDYGAWCP